VNFAKIGQVKTILFLKVPVDFCLNFVSVLFGWNLV